MDDQKKLRWSKMAYCSVLLLVAENLIIVLISLPDTLVQNQPILV